VSISRLASLQEPGRAIASKSSSLDATPLPGNDCSVFSPESGELLSVDDPDSRTELN